MNTLTILASLHAVATIAMFGLIWFVQIVHYPMFHRVGSDGFATYEAQHQQRTTWVVAPLMAVEAVTSVALLWMSEGSTTRMMAVLGVVFIVVIWLSTILLQVPCHRKLEAGYDATIAQRLVITNWVRTLAWTCRAPLAIAFLLATQS